MDLQWRTQLVGIIGLQCRTQLASKSIFTHEDMGICVIIAQTAHLYHITSDSATQKHYFSQMLNLCVCV